MLEGLSLSSLNHLDGWLHGREMQPLAFVRSSPCCCADALRARYDRPPLSIDGVRASARLELTTLAVAPETPEGRYGHMGSTHRPLEGQVREC